MFDCVFILSGHLVDYVNYAKHNRKRKEINSKKSRKIKKPCL